MPVIEKTVSRAMKAAKSGDIDHGEWAAPVGSERTADDCLWDDPDAAPAERYGYPIFKGDKLSAAGVGAALGRARKNAPQLVPHLEKIDAAIHAKEPMKEEKLDAAASGSWSEMPAKADGADVAMSVQSDGAIGREMASKHCPPGSKCSLKTHEGERNWTVAQHSPHAHGNMCIPQLAQTSGPKVPSDVAMDAPLSMPHGMPMHTLSHVKLLHKQSQEWGHNPQTTFTKPGEMPTTPMNEPAVAMSHDAGKAAKAFLGLN